MATASAIGRRRQLAMEAIRSSAQRISDVLMIEGPDDVPGGIRVRDLVEVVQLEVIGSFLTRAAGPLERLAEQATAPKPPAETEPAEVEASHG